MPVIIRLFNAAKTLKFGSLPGNIRSDGKDQESESKAVFLIYIFRIPGEDISLEPEKMVIIQAEFTKYLKIYNI